MRLWQAKSSILKAAVRAIWYRSTRPAAQLASSTRLVREIEGDLGGRRNLTRIERELVSAFVGSAVTLRYLNQQVALGDTSAINLTGYATTASTMLRIGCKLGLTRRQRDVMTLGDVLQADIARQQREAAP